MQPNKLLPSTSGLFNQQRLKPQQTIGWRQCLLLGAGFTEGPPGGAVSHKLMLPMPLLLLLADRLRTWLTCNDWSDSAAVQPHAARDTAALWDVVTETGQRPLGNVDGRWHSVSHRHHCSIIAVCHSMLSMFRHIVCFIMMMMSMMIMMIMMTMEC